MSRVVCSILLSIVFIMCATQSSQADVWVPPIGELISDSVFIDLEIKGDTVWVNLHTIHKMGKLVSDDYSFEFSRLEQGNSLLPNFTEIVFSDSLGDVDNSPIGLIFSGMSFDALEDTLSVNVSTRHCLVADHPIDEITIERCFNRNILEGNMWFDFLPVLFGKTTWARVTANESVTVSWHADNVMQNEWNEVGSGTDIEFSPEPDNWDLYELSFKIEIEDDDRYQIHKVITDSLQYVLSPEVRAETPGLIKTEDIRISISSYGIPDDYYGYYQYADIELNAGLAIQLAPMWLWYPNDITNASVAMEGIKSSQYWGNYREFFDRDSLEVMRVDGDNVQNGFFIHVPKMNNEWVGQEDWWWNEPHICVEVTGRHYGESARFIVITAPTESSRIRFSISSELEFFDWTNPYEYVDQTMGWQHRSIIFTGECPQPGEAVVNWRPMDVQSDELKIPSDYSLNMYPNPCNSTTTIHFSVPTASHVRLDLLDISGREVLNILDDFKTAASYEIPFNAMHLPGGVYMVRFVTEHHLSYSKILLLK